MLNKSSTAVLTVSQLTFQIKNQLESRFSSITVSGEITNCKLNSSGHLYFDLKDPAAKISAVMFKGKNSLLKRMPKEGDLVVAFGTLSLYPPQGKYQIIVDTIQYQGVGDLLLKLEELKKKLKERGWLSSDKKKPLPPFPKKIGVVTSPTGAVIRDILHVLSRRFKGFQLLLNPVKVQGEGAAQEIALAIRQFNTFHLVDVIIVARGGGSLEDLWPFNEEIVAEAIFQSEIPIISGVGHETDFTIADLVADVRAPTPSAAAEIVMGEREKLVQTLLKASRGIVLALTHLVKRHRATLTGFTRHPLLSNPYLIVGQSMQKLDEATKKLDMAISRSIQKKKERISGYKKELYALNPKTRIAFFRTTLSQFAKRVNLVQGEMINSYKNKLNGVKKHLFSLDPKNVLKRGYTILFSQKNHSVIVSSQVLKPQEEVIALLSDGKVKLQVVDYE